MNFVTKSAMFAVALGAISMGAIAQTTAPSPVINQHKDNQQDRIGNGVQNGSLTAGEATRLEKKETRINREEKRMKSDGNFTAAERAKVRNQQSHLSKQIYNQKHDAQVQNVNPKSEVGQRQRLQQERIGQGIKSGSLTPAEAARMENQEKHVNREVARDRAANGGTLTPGERARVNHQQNKVSKHIYHQKHDAQGRR
jgi:hypothetical protein